MSGLVKHSIEETSLKEETSIAVVSNIIFEPYFLPSIKQRFGNGARTRLIPYGEQKTMVCQSIVANADLVIVWIDFDTLFPNCWNALFSRKMNKDDLINDAFELCRQLYADLVAIVRSKIVWFLFEDYYTQFRHVTGTTMSCASVVDEINNRLFVFFPNITCINTKRLIAEIGIMNAYDNKGKYRWNAVHSKSLVELAVSEIHKQYLIWKGITKKCLILDCDNVLWGGIISEEGIENVRLGGGGLGKVYQDFQRFFLSLYYHGVILAICSKNDLSDVLKMFREHSEMILKEEHIACFQVNWEDKPSNIRKISEALNIDLDSMVFVDDSAIEIEAVRVILPCVTGILFKRDMEYGKFSYFNQRDNMDIEDVDNRNKTYQTNESREKLKAKCPNYEEYITALGVEIDIHEASVVECSRISELTQRTNKCTNGKRCTITEIKECIASDAVTLYSIFVSDKFSDLGLVGAIGIVGDVLRLFSVSCRALGREVEIEMMKYIRERHQIKCVEYRSTGKNSGIRMLLLDFFDEAVLLEL